MSCFFSPLEQLTTISILVVILLAAVAALGYRDYKKNTFSSFAFFFPLLLLAVMCSIVYTFSQSVELTLGRLAYGLCVVLVAPTIRLLLSSNRHFQQMVKDGETIANHWKNDKDLRVVNFFLILLRAFSLFILLLGGYFLKDFFHSCETVSTFKVLTVQEFLLLPGPLCMIVAFLMWCLTNIIELYYTYDIIFYRNTPTIKK